MMMIWPPESTEPTLLHSSFTGGTKLGPTACNLAEVTHAAETKQAAWALGCPILNGMRRVLVVGPLKASEISPNFCLDLLRSMH